MEYKLLNLISRLSLLVVFFVSSSLHAKEFKAVHISNEDLNWRKLSSNVWIAPISGSESTDGMYVYRVKFLPGYKNKPHYHTDERVVTVLSGSVLVGYGNVFDEKSMQRLKVGGVYTEPKNQPHYILVKDEEVILQVVGSGKSKRYVVTNDQ